ncbi:hypothetical protein DEO72_LG6g705 [Vigna unguiculata]|uniref:Armadillo-like repeats domain-containing protein n=1 Tax=Vigna unguiculata TaxID=3917 RepID=A0A4D6M807_VIGUN|nr:hypothetical protein DEO72_LG6g705 [Vigna unguiculata]
MEKRRKRSPKHSKMMEEASPLRLDEGSKRGTITLCGISLRRDPSRLSETFTRSKQRRSLERLREKHSAIPFHLTKCTTLAFPTVLTPRHPPFSLSSNSGTCSATPNSNNNATSNSIKNQEKEKEVEVEVEEELPWIQEKALDLVEFTASVTQAIPGPRVSKTPPCASRWMIYFRTEETKLRMKLSSKFRTRKVEVPFIGPIVMDKSGYTEKGFKRKIAVQALFGKVFYLSDLPEFCSRDSSLVVKEIFGVTDEDAGKLRIHTVSEAGSLDALEKMVDGSDSEDASDDA